MTTRLATLLADRPLGLRLARRSRGHRGRLGAQLGPARSDALPRGRQPAAHHRHPVRSRRAGERVRRLRAPAPAVGVAALGFGTEVVRVTPEPLVAACAAQDLPLLEVPYRTPFLALARRIADARAEQDHARDLWALDAQRALSLAALSAERIAGVLEELSRRLAAVVLLLDARGEVLSEHGQPRLDDAETARRADRGAPAAAPAVAVRIVPRPAESIRRPRSAGHHADARSPRRAPRACSRWPCRTAGHLGHRGDHQRGGAGRVRRRGRRSSGGVHAGVERPALPARAGSATSTRPGTCWWPPGRQLPEAPLRLLLTPLPGDSEAGELEHALTVADGPVPAVGAGHPLAGPVRRRGGTAARRAAAEVIGAPPDPGGDVATGRLGGSWSPRCTRRGTALDSAPATPG